jgi:hypothetical protein
MVCAARRSGFHYVSPGSVERTSRAAATGVPGRGARSLANSARTMCVSSVRAGLVDVRQPPEGRIRASLGFMA